uniref:Protein TIC 21, chloroplastic n=1 Tax=Kalanchoe fedtschenkoi TaxID=63787 RepID=A0A7N0TX76_KALFE
MQTLMLPAGFSAVAPPPLKNRTSAHPFPTHRQSLSFRNIGANRLCHFAAASSISDFAPLSSSPFVYDPDKRKLARRRFVLTASSAPASSNFAGSESEKAKLAQVAKRLETTARHFRRLGNLGFWGQLVCTLVSAVILSFSVVVTGKVTSPATFYATAGGIAAAFISVFWSFGYIRLSERLKKTSNDPSKAPPRADVVKSLKNGIVLNLLGMGAAILGMQATVGLLVAKALTSSANPYYQGISPGYSPVLALDVFLVQASANTILSHFLGLVFSLELLRSVTLPTLDNIPVTKFA